MIGREMQLCSLCNRRGHVAGACRKPHPSMQHCPYCKSISHHVADEETRSLGGVSASTADTEVKPIDPKAQRLSENEEREARKLEKKLREIAHLEERLREGIRLDHLQLKKLEAKADLEDRSVMRKVRLGYARVLLGHDK
mmetsp:Transcript_55537/g.132767  ORF Transcript_55537/g.132767 Transcript_55537/m.132767 type:complete len:140 (+) Transcript_55537:62-481(+)